ncbi:unnamed protein product [Orchesella dallaii]|uniref:BTB domain-containing protein n=1 Tax=Orchesella dallaii TaxID=48710 RepID=A0ABP1S6Q9_9HEXA
MSSSNKTMYYPVLERNKKLLGRVLLYMFDNWFQSCNSRLEFSVKSNWKRIFAIDPTCGVMLEKTLFEIQVGDYRLHYRIVLDRVDEPHEKFYNEIHRNQRVCFLNSSLSVFIGERENEKKVTFVMSLCDCGACQNPLQRWSESEDAGKSVIDFDVMELKPVDIGMKLSCYKEEQLLKLTFQPGVIDQFDMNNEWSERSNVSTVVYQSCVPLDSLTIHPFKDFYKSIEDAKTQCRPVAGLTPSSGTGNFLNNPGMRVAIKISRINPTPELLSPVDSKEKRAFNAIFGNQEHSDVKVISKDGKQFPCNKAVLVVRSAVFQSMLAEQRVFEGKEGKVILSEDAAATGALLRWIYFLDIDWEALDFKATFGTLKLAHLHGIMELVGPATRNLLEKMKSLKWEDVTEVMDLYDFARKIDTIQIVTRLKFLALMTLNRILRERKNKRIRRDDEDFSSSLASAFGNNSTLATAIVLDAFQLL